MVSDRVQRETRKPIDWCCLLYIGGAGGGDFLFYINISIVIRPALICIWTKH